MAERMNQPTTNPTPPGGRRPALPRPVALAALPAALLTLLCAGAAPGAAAPGAGPPARADARA
ncbi:hypothetical protein ACFWW8_34265, partial [Streptomyces sp. NPDC058701]